jgi:hypothetical protein
MAQDEPKPAQPGAVGSTKHRINLVPSERVSFAYDRGTGKRLTDEDAERCRHLREHRPWWMIW